MLLTKRFHRRVKSIIWLMTGSNKLASSIKFKALLKSPPIHSYSPITLPYNELHLLVYRHASERRQVPHLQLPLPQQQQNFLSCGGIQLYNIWSKNPSLSSEDIFFKEKSKMNESTYIVPNNSLVQQKHKELDNIIDLTLVGTKFKNARWTAGFSAKICKIFLK